MTISKRISSTNMEDHFSELDHTVLLTKLIDISQIETLSLIAEMEYLKNRGYLTTLRGERLTDLARPISKNVQSMITGECPTIMLVTDKIERSLIGTNLYLRTYKYDEARASSTHPTGSITEPHFHFDAELSSVGDLPGTIWQFYLNLGHQVRLFRVLPYTLRDVITKVTTSDKEVLEITPREAFARYQTLNHDWRSQTEDISVPSGYLAIFDGRTFAHDGAKGEFAEDCFSPSIEPDIVAAIDFGKEKVPYYGKDLPYYNPHLSFLEDIK